MYNQNTGFTLHFRLIRAASCAVIVGFCHQLIFIWPVGAASAAAKIVTMLVVAYNFVKSDNIVLSFFLLGVKLCHYLGAVLVRICCFVPPRLFHAYFMPIRCPVGDSVKAS